MSERKEEQVGAVVRDLRRDANKAYLGLPTLSYMLTSYANRLDAARAAEVSAMRLAEEALRQAIPWLADTCCEITKDARPALRLADRARKKLERVLSGEAEKKLLPGGESGARE